MINQLGKTCHWLNDIHQYSYVFTRMYQFSITLFHRGLMDLASICRTFFFLSLLVYKNLKYWLIKAYIDMIDMPIKREEYLWGHVGFQYTIPIVKQHISYISLILKRPPSKNYFFPCLNLVHISYHSSLYMPTWPSQNT